MATGQGVAQGICCDLRETHALCSSLSALNVSKISAYRRMRSHQLCPRMR